ncbi:hypothetical protein CJ030_MR0G006722 [Morella rubra]|uniref:Uncharacterized protein n=1 Tax=Morella rubra TaxID=262757 RepID=A0A6A1ULF5_9ROSI|nr:hypothetical protein CJ030_MR0G006722 [Morella rubra]
MTTALDLDVDPSRQPNSASRAKTTLESRSSNVKRFLYDFVSAFGFSLEMCNDGHEGRQSPRDPLQVPAEPITRPRAKKIKEAMQGLVQSTCSEYANLLFKTPAFKMRSQEEEPILLLVIQATEGGTA